MIFIGNGFGPLLLVALVVFGSLVFFGPLAPMLLVFILPVVLLFGLFQLLAQRSRAPIGAGEWAPPLEMEPPPDFEDVRRAARDDLLALADDIRALDIDIELPGATAEAKRDYGDALAHYERAARALDRARTPQHLRAVSEAVADGRHAISSVEARLEGRTPPERRPPCFFDPRHGPSVRDVHWAPPGGTTRPVPACAADAVRIEEGQAPLAREVLVHGERRPYWNAPPHFAPWAGGYFAGTAGAIVPALFFGSLLGTGLGVGGSIILADEAFDSGDYGSDFTTDGW